MVLGIQTTRLSNLRTEQEELANGAAMAAIWKEAGVQEKVSTWGILKNQDRKARTQVYVLFQQSLNCEEIGNVLQLRVPQPLGSND